MPPFGPPALPPFGVVDPPLPGRDEFGCCASDEVTVVLDTCLEPEDLRPLEEPTEEERERENKEHFSIFILPTFN